MPATIPRRSSPSETIKQNSRKANTRGDASFAIAQSNLLSKNFKDAAAQMAALENDPQLREQALLFEAEAFKAAGKTDDAIRTLEKLAGHEIRTPDTMRGATTLAQLYAQKGDGAKALRTLEAIHQKIALADNIIELNALTIELGDKFYDKQQFKEALACYRYALPREEIVRLQNDRIAEMQRRIEENVAAIRANPTQITQLTAANNQLKASIANAQKAARGIRETALNNIGNLPAPWPLLLRARSQMGSGRRQPGNPRPFQGRFGAGTGAFRPDCRPRRNQPAAAGRGTVRAISARFSKRTERATVGYLSGAVALQAGDPKSAEAYFNRILETQPKSQFREQIRYLLGNTEFMAGSYDEAVTAYKKYLSEFPKGASTEDVKYRIALCALFAGKYQDAMNQLQDYVAKHPNGSFLPDAKYRLAVCKYAASLYDEVIADCQAWERQFPSNPQLGEVLALLGDACAASDRESAAIPVYIRSYQTATTDEVMNYSLFAASKLLQKQGEWDKVGELFSGFVKDKPDNLAVVSALYWIGKAKSAPRQN